MKFLKRLSVLILLSSSFFYSNAQSWNRSQKEVWKTVQAYNNLFKEGKYDEILSYMDENYTGWPFGSDTPVTKAALIKSFAQNTGEVKALSRVITPLVVRVYGNFAYADYSYKETDQYKNGKQQTYSGAWMDLLILKNHKWYLLADHGGTPLVFEQMQHK